MGLVLRKLTLVFLAPLALWPLLASAQEGSWDSYMNAAVAAHRRGDDLGAEKNLQAALGIAETFARDDPRLAQTLEGLALVYFDQGRDSEAEALLSRVLVIGERLWGPEHPRLASGLNALALIYTRQGRYDGAETLYGRALGIFEKALGRDHIMVARVLENMAGLFTVLGRYEAAATRYRDALAILEKVLGVAHPNLAIPLESYAGVLRLQGRRAQAETLESRAKTLRDRPGGSVPQPPGIR